MKIRAAIEFKDLFKEEREAPSYYLKEIPTIQILTFLSIINTRLFNLLGKGKSESNLFIEILNYISPEEKENIIRCLSGSPVYIENGGNLDSVGFFSEDVLVDLMVLAINNSNDLSVEIENAKEKSKSNLLMIFKAYMSLRALVNKKTASERNDNIPTNDFEHFIGLLWKPLIKQNEYYRGTSFLAEAIKGFYFLDFLAKSEYKKYLENFLEIHGVQNHFRYIVEVIKIIQELQKSSISEELFSSNIKINDPINLLANYFIDKSNMNDLENADLNTLKSKPLLKINANHYYVLDIKFLINKLYSGLIYDVYYTSGLNKDVDFMRFRSLMGGFTDKHYFSNIFSKILLDDFHFQWSEPENETHKGFPDYYARNTNKLYLFEIKDVTFNESKMQNLDLDSVQKMIVEKICSFGSKATGAGQLLKTIQKLDKEGFHFDEFRDKQWRNLRVFPIIIHSNHYLTLPGINVLVEKLFREEVEKSGFQRINSKYIQPPVLIHIDFFMIEYPKLRYVDGVKFNSLITNYLKKLKRYKKVGFISKSEQEILTESYKEFTEVNRVGKGIANPTKFLEKLGLKELLSQ